MNKRKEIELLWPFIKEKFCDIEFMNGYIESNIYIEDFTGTYIVDGRGKMLSIKSIKKIHING